MKKNYIILTVILMVICIFLPWQEYAQSPEKMSYQAVIRNSSNKLVQNQEVGMQISIIQGSADSTAVYIETQNPTTNANGLVSVEIGGGTILSGNFATIDWANGPYLIRLTAVDILNNPTNICVIQVTLN